MDKFKNSDKFCLADMPEREALVVMDAIGAIADSVDVGDRVKASDLFNTSGNHGSLEVVKKALEVSGWLISHELFAGNFDRWEFEDVDPLNPRSTIQIETEDYVHQMDIPLSADTPYPVHPIIQKNVIRELAMIGARTETEAQDMSARAVSMLGVLSMRSLMSSEARLAIGWVGRATPHHELAKDALGILSGTLINDNDHGQFDMDPITASVMGLYAIGERSDEYLATESIQAIEDARLQFPYPMYDQAFTSGSRRQIGYGSPFTSYLRNDG